MPALSPRDSKQIVLYTVHKLIYLNKTNIDLHNLTAKNGRRYSTRRQIRHLFYNNSLIV